MPTSPLRDPRAFQIDLAGSPRPARHALAERWAPGLKAASLKASSPRDRPARDAVRVLVVHATAGASSEGACSVVRGGRASFHWLVPDEDEAAHGVHVWACASEARAAWHVRNDCSHPEVCGGARRLNHLSLGAEIVNAQAGGDAFSAWQVEAMARIARYAWAKYENLAHIVSHARLDPARRSDPGAHFPWEDFSKMVIDGV